ncbi:MAG: outer membrane lipoprotein carrier protein LolA [Myxococcales bacterium]|nr:outer membrane lipoprotein carrier protein LolA [Myxococcales bacterium]
MSQRSRVARAPRWILASCALSALVSGVLAAQAPAARVDARGLAAIVQSFYDQTTTMEARFEQTQYTKVYDRTERASGRVVFKKPGKMRWDYAAPNGQVFVSDGQRLLVYQPPDEGEQQGQLIERQLSEDQLPLAFSFLTGTGRLDRDFRLRLVDAARQDFAEGHVLELRPRRPTPHYDRVLFFVRLVGEGAQRAGVIQRVLILDSAGNRNRFDFSELRFNRDVPESRFDYRPPANTRRVRP